MCQNPINEEINNPIPIEIEFRLQSNPSGINGCFPIFLKKNQNLGKIQKNK